MDTPTLVGAAAVVASTASFSPQAVKIIRTRDTSAISAVTYAMTVVGFGLWLVYGALLGEWPLILTNTICLLLSAFILAMKLMSPRERDAVADTLDPST